MADFQLAIDNSSPNNSHSSIFSFEDEQDWRDSHWKNFRQGDVVLDIGAGYGSYSLPAAALGAKVYAFEPDPARFATLQQNIIVNRFSDLISPIQLAVSDTDGELVVEIEGNTEFRCQSCRLDTFVRERQLDRMDYIKLDVEGDELLVLAGAKKSLIKHRPTLSIEIHTFKGIQIDAVTSWLQSLAYVVLDSVSRWPAHLIWAIPVDKIV